MIRRSVARGDLLRQNQPRDGRRAQAPTDGQFLGATVDGSDRGVPPSRAVFGCEPATGQFAAEVVPPRFAPGLHLLRSLRPPARVITRTEFTERGHNANHRSRPTPRLTATGFDDLNISVAEDPLRTGRGFPISSPHIEIF